MRPVTLLSEPAYEGLADNHSQETPDGGAVGACCAITHEATGCDLSYGNGSTGRTLSDRALELVDGPRQDSYAPPEVNLGRIGAMWAAILSEPDAIPGWKVALMLSALKIARAAHRPDDDSLVDAVGYLEIVERLRP